MVAITQQSESDALVGRTQANMHMILKLQHCVAELEWRNFGTE